MIFKLNENDSVELKYSFRSSIYFEQIANHSLDLTNFTANDLITLFYSVVVASLQKAKKPIISMLAFMDYIDDFNGGDKCIIDFSNWYVNILKNQYELLADEKEDKKEEKSKGKKKQA